MKSLEFTLTVSPCLGCAVCPQSALAAAYTGDKAMTEAKFFHVMSALPNDVVCDFSGFSEPFLHKDAAHFMRLAATNHETRLFSTLMGLSEVMLYNLGETKFSYIRLHVPDGHALKIPKEVWLRQFNLFRKTGHSFTAMAMGPIEDDDFVKILADRGVGVEFPPMLSRAGNVTDLHSHNYSGPIRCAADRWHNNVLLPNGDVVACCMDWSLTMPLGNLLREPYATIETRANVYERNNNPPADSICRKCEWAAPL